MLELTSLIFGTNALHAYAKGRRLYAVAFAALTLTSVLFHTIRSAALFWIDQSMVWFVMGTGGLYFVQYPSITAFATFIAVVILYAFGYLTSSMCFDDSKETRLWSHGSMHIISSIGHHCIISAL